MLLKNQSKHSKYIGWYEWLEERIDLNEPDIENNQEIESEETQTLSLEM